MRHISHSGVFLSIRITKQLMLLESIARVPHWQIAKWANYLSFSQATTIMGEVAYYNDEKAAFSLWCCAHARPLINVSYSAVIH